MSPGAPDHDHPDVRASDAPMIRSACQVAGVWEFLVAGRFERDRGDQAVLLEVQAAALEARPGRLRCSSWRTA